MAGTTTKKVIIRIIVALFLISSGLTFVLYLIAPSQAAPSNESVPAPLENTTKDETVNIITPTNEVIDLDDPENNDIQIVISENEDKNELDETVEVVLENGEIDTPTLSDFSDSLQLSQ